MWAVIVIKDMINKKEESDTTLKSYKHLASINIKSGTLVMLLINNASVIFLQIAKSNLIQLCIFIFKKTM